MDSASLSLSVVARDGSSPAAGPTVEDDVVLSAVAGLAKEAALLFQAGNFVDCLGALNQLLQKKDDPKVRHNIVIVERFEDGCSDPKKLVEALESIKKQSEELAHASGEPSDAMCNDGERPMDGTKGANNAVHPHSTSSGVCGNEFDTSVATFNIAVVWFHLLEYEKSFSYLDALYQNIVPLDEGTALRICLLLLDVALLSHHASRSADVISYIEKVFRVDSFTNQVDSGISVQQQSLLASKSSLPSSSSLPDSTHTDSVATANTSLEKSLARTSSEEALEDESLQLLLSLDIGGQNIQRLIVSSNDLPRSQAEESISVVDLRLKLHLYKVRFLLLTRNLKAAKREVKMAMNLARGKDYPMALYLKSQLEYTCRNYRKAIKLLMASNNCMETGISCMYYNNLGCIYYQLGRQHTSGVFFSKALKNSSHARKGKAQKLLTLSQDKSFLISYNCGMHSLACGRPFHAAKCFQKASLVFYHRPLLWLRIAECCLMALEKGLIKYSAPAFDRYGGIIANAIGKGKWRQLALRYGISPYGQYEYAEKDQLCLGDCKQPDLSMSLARLCLVNVLHLLDSSEAKYSKSALPHIMNDSESREKISSQITDHEPAGELNESNLASGSFQINSNGEVKEQKCGNNQSASLQNSITDYEHNCAQENYMIRQATLADLAYVEMALGNPLKALSAAKSLLKLPECSRIYVFLGTMYVAEALCLLNQPKEAAEHLMTYVLGGNNVELPYSLEDCERWKVEKVIDSEDLNVGGVPNALPLPYESKVHLFSSPEEARGIFCANYAANLAMLGDFERARHFVMKAFSDIPNNPRAILIAIYLDLKCGKTREALVKLKQHSGISFLPGSCASSHMLWNGSS